MRAIIYVSNSQELASAVKANCCEVIIAPKLLSRRGTLEMAAALELIAEVKSAGLIPVVEWDALMTESHFLNITRELTQNILCETYRVRDAGAAFWLKTHYPNISLQLLLEAGHHNLPALKSWVIRLGSQLKRICLSPELPATTIKLWRSELKLEIEVLGLGPLLLFHSGRPLLTSLESAPEGEEVIAEGASEESPHKGFILQENLHGTMMFHPKDLGLLERWDDLQAAGVDVVRIDHRQQGSAEAIALLFSFLREPTQSMAQVLKDNWDREWMRGYFDVNKSDILFPKLKNNHLRQRDGETLGEVIEGKREGWLAVHSKGEGLRPGLNITALDPKGNSKNQKIYWLKDSGFKNVDHLAAGEVGFIAWFASAPTATVLLKAKP